MFLKIIGTLNFLRLTHISGRNCIGIYYCIVFKFVSKEGLQDFSYISSTHVLFASSIIYLSHSFIVRVVNVRDIRFGEKIMLLYNTLR